MRILKRRILPATWPSTVRSMLSSFTRNIAFGRASTTSPSSSTFSSLGMFCGSRLRASARGQGLTVVGLGRGDACRRPGAPRPARRAPLVLLAPVAAADTGAAGPAAGTATAMAGPPTAAAVAGPSAAVAGTAPAFALATAAWGLRRLREIGGVVIEAGPAGALSPAARAAGGGVLVATRRGRPRVAGVASRSGIRCAGTACVAGGREVPEEGGTGPERRGRLEVAAEAVRGALHEDL